ncbi:MAG: hypothetical protein Q9227_001487 [Pyrenula ochraceoflavens]
MAPLRLGIIGLSASPTAWASLAHLPHLLRNPSLYTITALCNSSRDAALSSISAHGLPSSTKAYGSPSDLAADPDVDVVVVSARVDLHYQLAKPCVQAGKDVLCEWPLGANSGQAKELAEMARKKGVKTGIILQGHWSGIMQKFKTELIDSAKLGTLTSVGGTFYSNTCENGRMSERYHYLVDRKIGGNVISIHMMHWLETLSVVFGELEEGWSTTMGTYQKTVKVGDGEGWVQQKDTPDEVLLQGKYAEGPVLAVHLNTGPPCPGEPASKVVIHGIKGQAVIELPTGLSLHIAHSVNCRFVDFETGHVETINLGDDIGEETQRVPSLNVGKAYDAFAQGKGLDWDFAVKRHQMVDEIWKKAGW